jgi:hypothetical protein
MPSENTFNNQIELVHAFLGAFESIAKIDAPAAIKGSLESLSSATSDLHKFIPYYNNRPVYTETLSRSYEAMDQYFSRNPSVAKPFSFLRVVGLYSTAKGLSVAERQGMYF